MRSQITNIIATAIFIAWFFPFIGYSQVIYDGQVVDKDTELALPGVTVWLLKENVAASTNDQGYFNLTSINTLINDTLVFSSVGYHSFKLPVSAYKENLFLLLHPSNTNLQEVGITSRKLKDITLNKFVWADIADDKYVTPFSTNYAFAKLFTAPNGNMVLKSVALARKRRQHVPIKTTVNTRFLLNVMSVNRHTGEPDKILFSKTVSLTDNAQLIRLDLSTDKIVISDSQFYISIEWLRVPYNEVISMSSAPRVRKVTKKKKDIYESVTDYRTTYQPTLIAMLKKKGAVSWVKINRGKWIPQNSATKNTGIDVALSATVHH